MNYIKKYESYKKASSDNSRYTVYYSDGGTFSSYFFSEKEAINFAINLTKKNGIRTITIFDSNCSNLTDFKYLKKWWGQKSCIWYNQATDFDTIKPWLNNGKGGYECDPIILEKYLFGLQGVIDEVIPSLNNPYGFYKYIKTISPELWNKLYNINNKIDLTTDMGEMGF